MEVFTNNRVPIKCWAEGLEESARKQADNLANLPFTFKHVALMPDAHMGYGMPIGGVLATEKVIIPNAVGVDIGCGMSAVQTPWTVDEVQDKLKQIMGRIRKTVPVGFAHHQKAQDFPESLEKGVDSTHIIKKEHNDAKKQIGTLGGGNHFIEVQKDSNNIVWIMLHSGSRNLGFKVAKFYNDLATDLTGKWFSYVPKEWQLAFLPVDSDEGQKYLQEMNYCVEFAFENRKRMMRAIIDAFEDAMKYKKVDFVTLINIAHNYVAQENHFGQNVWVHRKGAVRVRENETAIIPGSMGSSSYIGKGLGNPMSFMSCSHGAGRRMGRKEATRTLNLDEEQKKMDGIIHGIRTVADLEEAPGAYKDIDSVMAAQKDLVEIMGVLKPIASIKG